jgi:hypothetical protein
MEKPIPYLIQGKNIVLVLDNQSHNISRDSHIAYDKIVDAIKAKDWDKVRELVEPKKAIINYGNGDIEIKNNVIYWKGNVFHNSLSTRMIQMFVEGFPIEPMTAFMNNLMQNPSHRSVTQLYDFLDKNKLPITDDGYFLAFKKVNKDFKDIHSGTFDNSVGKICEIERNAVNDDPTQTCSTGLHFCSQSYLPNFGTSTDPVMIIKINPKDVVSIPVDYDGAKGRCCRYEVVGQLGVAVEEAEASFTAPVNNTYTPKPKGLTTPKPKQTTDPWPFPTSKRPDDILYNVVRVKDNKVVALAIKKDAAEEMIARNKKNKKAQLKMVPHS